MGDAIAVDSGHNDADVDAERVPPQSALDFEGLAKIATNLSPQATAPSNPQPGWMYLDDGSNTNSERMALRRYDGTAWQDIDNYVGTIDGGDATTY